MKDQLLSFFTEKGTLVEPAAIERILSQENPIQYAESIFSKLEERPLILTLDHIIQVESIVRDVARIQEIESVKEGRRTSKQERGGKVRAKDLDPEVEIKKDITGCSTCEGTIEDFQRYFKHRFEMLSVMLKEKREMRGCIDVSKAKKKTTEMKFVCIVNSVRRTKSGGVIVEVEDCTDVASVLVPKGAIGGRNIVPDEVIGIMGKSWKNDLIIADRIVRPDIPGRRSFPGCDYSISVAFVSDIHVGSKAFMQDKWEKFIRWLNNGDDLSSSIKYIVIPGDVVDGIGIYPSQDEELSIHDIYEQYEELAGLLEPIPDHIQIIICPGNHDAVRPAEPQPSLPKNIVKLFPSDMVFAGNPTTVLLHGVEVLVYHGRSIDDFVATVPSLTYENPLESMKEMLMRRHLAPTYGGKTPIAPESSDYLVIDSVPDIFVTGHVHSVGVEEYRGVKLINASTWQTRTSYQRMRNIDPIPAKVPIVDLRTGKARIMEF